MHHCVFAIVAVRENTAGLIIVFRVFVIPLDRSLLKTYYSLGIKNTVKRRRKENFSGGNISKKNSLGLAKLYGNAQHNQSK